jgi:hypothetical protein
MPTPVAAPAYFEITVEARTPYSLFIDGKPIEANACYKTEPITEVHCVEIEIRYVCGEEVIKKKFFVDLEPGYKHRFLISLSARPSYVWC